MPVAKGSAERVRRAYGCIQILRVLLGYGIECGIADCRRLRSDMEGMRFPRNPPRDKTMPFEQAEAFVTEALKRNETGLALAQALQFECFLRQNDVIGTWRDKSEDYPLQPGEIRIGAKVWRGLTWDRLRLGDDLLIRTSKTGQPVTHAIDACALVVRCLRSRAPAPTNGPIVTRKDGLPFMDRRSYAKAWRQIATAVGLPKELWNMDTRASALPKPPRPACPTMISRKAPPTPTRRSPAVFISAAAIGFPLGSRKSARACEPTPIGRRRNVKWRRTSTKFPSNCVRAWNRCAPTHWGRRNVTAPSTKSFETTSIFSKN